MFVWLSSVPIDMPADIALEVHFETLAHKLKRLRFFLHAVENQALHCKRFAVLRNLLQDLVSCLDALFVLLRLIALDYCPEGAGFLRRQLLRILASHLGMCSPRGCVKRSCERSRGK